MLFIAANLLFALFHPPLGKLTLYNHILPGRLRFPYEQEPADYFTGVNAPVYENFDAMFGAHVVSQKKADHGFRVFLLGDSSTWGISVQPGDMLSEQLNRQGLETCDGRRVRVYNLGYPMPFLMRDLLILDKAMEYEPDLVLWLVTLSTFEPKTAETYFIQPHAEQFLRLSREYNLSYDEYAEPMEVPSLFHRTIVPQKVYLKIIIFNQAMGFFWYATGIDNHEGLDAASNYPSPDVEDDPAYEKKLPGDVPVVWINQPILMAAGVNSDVRYNAGYPRWIYDEYRGFISDWTAHRNHAYLDFWNILSLDDFADQNFHRNPGGEKHFAGRVAPELEKIICDQT